MADSTGLKGGSAALRVDGFVLPPRRPSSVRWDRMHPCLSLVLCCSLSDSSFLLCLEDVNLTHVAHSLPYSGILLSTKWELLFPWLLSCLN